VQAKLRAAEEAKREAERKAAMEARKQAAMEAEKRAAGAEAEKRAVKEGNETSKRVTSGGIQQAAGHPTDTTSNLPNAETKEYGISFLFWPYITLMIYLSNATVSFLFFSCLSISDMQECLPFFQTISLSLSWKFAFSCHISILKKLVFLCHIYIIWWGYLHNLVWFKKFEYSI